MADSKADFINKARPLAEELITYAMDKGKKYGITDVRIDIGANEKQENSVEGGIVSSVVSGDSFGISVMLFAGDRFLSFTKNDTDEAILHEAIDQNMQAIAVVPENPNKRLLESAKLHKGAIPDLDLYDQNPPSQQELIDYAMKVEEAALAQPHVKTTESDITVRNTHSFSLATNGLDLLESKTRYSAGTMAVAEDSKGNMQNGFDYSEVRRFSDMTDPVEIGKNAGQDAAAKLGAIKLPTGEMPIILSPDAATEFFSLVYKAIDGTAVHRELTFWKDKIGQQVMSEGITIEDDPLIVKGLSSNPIDSAGQAAEKITFIEKGILKLFNVNLEEALQIGVEPIGRDDGPTNRRVLPGSQTPENLMYDIKEGIYIKGFQGGNADVNSGDYSRSAYGLLIKDGKVTGIAVDGFALGGDLKDMFMDVSVANDTPALPNTKHTFVAPTTRINVLKISGL